MVRRPLARASLSALALVLVTASSAVEASDPPRHARLAILASVVHRAESDAELGASAPFDEAAAAASWAPDLTVLPRSELAESGLDDQLRACGADVRCIAGRLRRADVELALLVVADLGIKPPMVTTRVVDARVEKVLATSVAEVGPEGLRAVLRAEVTRTLGRAGWAPGGRVAVETKPGDALVSVRTVAGAVALDATARHEAAATNVFVLPPGAYELAAEREGWVRTSTRTVVRAGEEARVWLELRPEQSVLASPWFWTAVIGLAAIGGGAAFFATRREDALRPLCQARGGAACE